MKKNRWFSKTVYENESKLIRYTQKIIKALEPSKEIVQEGFLRLWKEEFPNQTDQEDYTVEGKLAS